MNLPDLNFSFLLDLAQTLAVVALWLRKPGQDASNKADQLKGRVDVIEEKLKHMPSSAELTELEGSVHAIRATLEGLQQAQEAVRAALARIETYLLNHNGR